ncbi:MAG TPA: AAA family ATPase [Thermomicrobiales bacterium]|jgi:DNA-binding CsgD family transcriptional regulator
MADQTRHTAPGTTAPPLVGRERESIALRTHLDAALAGRGSLVLIGGEAGIGKTALAEATLAEAAGQGALVLVGRCYDLSETPPYGPWIEALERAPVVADLPALPTVILPPGHEGEVLTSQDAIVRRVRDYLAAIAVRRPTVLLLDDLHWADPASLDLLRVVARGLATSPLLVLATYRSDELTRRHPLYALLPALERETRAARLDLRPLDAAALRALVGRYALIPAEANRLVAWLRDRAEGNAFFSVQLVRALEEAGALRRAGDGWALGDLGAIGLPAPLRQVLDARLLRLGEAHLRLLTPAAVIGQEVPLALWATVADTDEDGLLDAIDAAEAAHLVVATQDGAAIRFAHAFIREALYAVLPATRRRRVHRRVAEALAAMPAPDPDAVAYHLQRAGEARAYAWLVRAGERAQRAYAWLTAADRFEAALAAAEAGGTDASERGWLLLRLARMRRYADPGRGVAHLGEALRLGAQAGDRCLVAECRFNRGLFRCLADDIGGGVAEMAAGVAAFRALSEADRARLRALSEVRGSAFDEHDRQGTLAMWLAYTGRHAEAEALAAPYGTEAELPADAGGPGGSAYADAHWALGWTHSAMGRPEAARRAFAHARDAYEAVGHHRNAAAAILVELEWVVLPYRTDQLAERQRLLAEGERAWARAGGTHAADSAAEVRLPLQLLEGRWAEARPALEARRDTGPTNWRARVALRLGPLARAQGDADLVRALVREWLPAGPAGEPGESFLACALVLQRLAAALALDGGDRASARSWLEAHDRWLAWSGAALGRAEGALGWAAYHRAAGDGPAARRHAEAALARAADPRQPLALLAAHRLLGELDTAEGRPTEAADHLAEVLELADACAAPYERALTLLALTELHLATGDRALATATLAEGRALLEPLEARPALARADALAARLAALAPAPAPAAPPFGLTAREVAVLRLVAEGLTDAEVAARLFVTRNTVNFHLKAVYGKLGVNTRAAAGRIARDHGLA